MDCPMWSDVLYYCFPKYTSLDGSPIHIPRLLGFVFLIWLSILFLRLIYCGRSHLRSRTLGVRTLRLKMVRKRGEKVSSVLKRNAEEYCKYTSLHGFAYWVQAHNAAEKIFWIAFTILSIMCAGLIISSAIRDWRENPGVMRIESFSKVKWKSVF